ncbi:MAG: hypothetical protein ACFB22_10855 [Rhodothalassiaceae bacterium]
MKRRPWYMSRPLWLIIPLICLPVLVYSYVELESWVGASQQVTQLGLGLVLFLGLIIAAAALAVAGFKTMRHLMRGARGSILDLQKRKR